MPRAVGQRRKKTKTVVALSDEEMEVDEKPEPSTTVEKPTNEAVVNGNGSVHSEPNDAKKNIEDDEAVVAEIPLILLRPPDNQSVDRLLFNHRKPATLENCTAKHKAKVKHVELAYNSSTSKFGNNKDVFDGQYFGESSASASQLEKHACAFYHDGKMYLVPIQNTYDMQRRVYSKKSKDDVEKAKLDDAKLAQLNAPVVANTVRVKFARQETEWQKKRREQSSNYRQQLIDQDPWLDLKVKKGEAVDVFENQIEQAKNNEVVQFEEDKIPVL
ncbi:unnamed protein product [Bursaphelenchus okinawaensis]|uniref:Uncharacterized protein n=1 Tax=Bursaphelenchus okinawaensis TaxID=465554 RepID=A0A811K261_9BILA|nr:unnamed protein product [Bursaphelenchus okinawaensis]CAG9090319.1 unnamed protein product [Bursaphelenchus okinawaensis]